HRSTRAAHRRRPRHARVRARRPQRELRRADGPDECTARRGLPEGGARRPGSRCGAVIERPSAETLRWTASFTLVVGVHGAAALLALEWTSVPAPAGAPPAAMLIDLAPAAPQPEPVVPAEEPAPQEPELV